MVDEARELMSTSETDDGGAAGDTRGEGREGIDR